MRINKGRENQNKKPAFGTARFEITGEVRSVYQGKKYNYVTVRVQSENGYYTDYSVTVPQEYDFDEGEKISFAGDILCFFDKSTQKSSYVFSAATIEEVNA